VKQIKLSSKFVFLKELFFNKQKEDTILKQLRFGFYQLDKEQLIIQFPLRIKEKLIEQMADATVKVNQQKGEGNNEKHTHE
jgi:hypothetical protein